MDHLKDILEKLKSDRLWAALGFVVLVIVNTQFHWLTDEQLKDIMWVTITFVVGKSLRGTSIGNIIESVIGGATTTKVQTTTAVTTPQLRQEMRPEDAP